MVKNRNLMAQIGNNLQAKYPRKVQYLTFVNFFMNLFVNYFLKP